MPPSDHPSPRGERGTGLTETSPALQLDQLYARYWNLVIAYLRGQGVVDPEDLASEAFVGVVRGLDNFEGDEAAFRSWVLVIAHRRLLDERRRHWRRPSDAVQPDRLHHIAEPGPMGRVEEEALDRVGTARVVAALDQLTDDQRTVVLMHTLGGLTLPQIAQALQKRLSAVKSLHRRGLAAAARTLGEPVADEPVGGR